MTVFSRVLLDWYAEHRRELPWRETKDPYRIWISEIILQQTRVVQGYEYFLRFVERFPDLVALAEADEDEVMKYWQGLGYYSRARNLHAAARSMNGVFPRTYEGVRALKGVGDYTAAAICSIAYDMPYAVVDGNVYRVLSRYFGVEVPIDSVQGKKLFASLAQEMLDEKHVALYNQAIMDFGAIQCTPQSPSCMFCPLADSCSALATGKVALLPIKQYRTKTTDRYFTYIYICVGGQMLLRKRTGNDIWRNLYELPLIETDRQMTVEELLLASELKELGTDVEPIVRPLQIGVKHVLSHQIIHADFYEMIFPADIQGFSDYIRIGQREWTRYAVPRLIHQFLEKYA
ncbi:A/G-specific adenine glycosylase [uncultured Bacteroides sp.]|uniref:A/G-specific adenine glycosylase n=1 Tax=uncultured Bacteroides sp. TaxID=162156 RepID=UPI00261AD9CA|nr:A/G-specific adenine glycosylase [uncultured Bacteroides sp.]